MNKDNINKILNYQVPPKIANTVLFIFLFGFSCLLFVFNTERIAVASEEILYNTFWTDTRYRMTAYYTFVIIFGVLFCLVGNIFISYVIMEIITICWGIANRVVFFTRDQFISIKEFKVLDEAMAVDVDRSVIFHPVIVWLILIGIVVGIFMWILAKEMKVTCKDRSFKRKINIIKGVLISMLISIFVFMYTKMSYMSWDNILTYRTSGCVIWFCQSLFGNITEGVEYEEIEKIYNDFSNSIVIDEDYSNKKPNIIVIMSEAFWDIENFNGLVEPSKNPMENYNELVKHAITGEVAVNVYGGGTNKTEFEFLTGINTRYLDETDCYGVYYTKNQESLVSYMEELGYYTMAFHPYEGDYWNRNIGYSNMGFDIFYSDVDFQNKEICHGYISDKALTNEIIKRFEEQKENHPEQPVFAFAVSVQNHVGNMSNCDVENVKAGCTGIDISINGIQLKEKTIEDVEEYYNGMSKTIEALEELIDYYENYEEDTMIVFFGDHAPSFAISILGKESGENLYRTPYMIWTNYENDYKDYGDFNITYLSTVLVDYLDFPRPNQYYLNRYMLDNYPINTRYEQRQEKSLDEQKVLDMMSVTTYLHRHLPKDEIPVPFWSIIEYNDEAENVK